MTALVQYERARQALAEAKSFDEVKAINDKAEAMRLYARMADDPELEQMAAEIRLRAKRLWGEMAKVLKDAGLLREGRPTKRSDPRTVSLADLQVSKNFSAESQRTASISERAFEAMVGRIREQIASGHRVGLSTEEKQERRAQRLAQMADLAANPLALPQGPFGAGVADPPWENPDAPIGFNERHYRAHYATMTAEQIAAMPVAAIFGPVAFLALWITRHHLAIGSHLAVLPAWGFEPKTIVTWDKELIGLGNGYVRDRSEHIVFAVRGKPPAPPASLRPASIFVARRSDRHSEKPLWPHQEIEQWFAPVTKVELFARSGRPGWTSWGSESESIDPETGELHAAVAAVG